LLSLLLPESLVINDLLIFITNALHG